MDAINLDRVSQLSSKFAGELSRNPVPELAAKSGLDTVSRIAIDDDLSAMRVEQHA